MQSLFLHADENRNSLTLLGRALGRNNNIIRRNEKSSQKLEKYEATIKCLRDAIGN